MIDVTAAVIKHNALILCAKRSKGKHLENHWEFPGGKIEENETPEECLQRELKEEFTIETEIGEFIAESIFDYGKKNIRLLAFYVNHISGEFKLIDHDEIRWLNIEQLDELNWAPADLPIIEALKQQDEIKQTTSFYSENAETYSKETLMNNVNHIRDRFISLLPDNAHILDLGCGSGRDSKEFKDLGFLITPLESSKELANLASRYIGESVLNIRYQQLQDLNKYDAIWACASLLHCPKSQIKYVLQKCINSLKNDGIFYFSFKYGEGERLDKRGRFFNDYTAKSLKVLMLCFDQIEILDIWEESTLLRGEEQIWVNGLIRKVGFK